MCVRQGRHLTDIVFRTLFDTKHGDTENNKRRVEATEMDGLRRSSRISRKDRIRNVTVRQQIGLEETIIKEMNKTSSYGMFKEWQKKDYPK